MKVGIESEIGGLNQNLDFKAKFPTDKIMDIETPASSPANPAK